MNTRNYMVIVKGEIKTSEIMSCIYNRDTQKWDVKFNNGKTKAFFKYGITDWNFYKQDISRIITTFQTMYYRAKQAELSVEVGYIEKYLNSVKKDLLEDLCNQSMAALKDKLARKYETNNSRKYLVKVICGNNHTKFW